MKRTNEAADVAESAEGRGPARGNAKQPPGPRTQSRQAPTIGLQRVRAAARRDREAQLTALLHHVTVDLLRTSYFALKRKASAGVDGMTWAAYGSGLDDRLMALHTRLHRGSYRTRPSRRVTIPKEDGRERQLGIAALEDKVVQRAVASVLEQIYEVDFRPFSYGFRPGRSQQDALDALWVGLMQRRVNWVLDADIQRYFDTINHEWLMKFLEHRIGDRRVLRVISKWLKAGYMDGTTWKATEEGTPQGSGISPLLANVYLHYAFDLWVEQWRRRHATGDVIVVRYADDFVMGFQHRADAVRFLAELRDRLSTFALELHPEKTRLIEFGRFASRDRERRGERKPPTFDFLGFTHISGVTRNGKFIVQRCPMRKRVRRTLKAVAVGLRQRMHLPRPAQGAWLASVFRGWSHYYAVPGTSEHVSRFRSELIRMWRRTLQRRSHKARRTWTWPRMAAYADTWLPRPRILQPYPTERLHVPPQSRSRMR